MILKIWKDTILLLSLVAEDHMLIKKQESIKEVMGLSKDDEITNEVIEEYIKRHKLLKNTK